MMHVFPGDGAHFIILIIFLNYSYNFEEHVEEFPALSLSQTNSRKASECHSEQPSPSSPKLLLDQQQASLF